MRLVVCIRRVEAVLEVRRRRDAIGVCFDGSPRIDRKKLRPGEHVAVDVEMRCLASGWWDGRAWRQPDFELRDSERISAIDGDFGRVTWRGDVLGSVRHAGFTGGQGGTRPASLVLQLDFLAGEDPRWCYCAHCHALIALDPDLHACYVRGLPQEMQYADEDPDPDAAHHNSAV